MLEGTQMKKYFHEILALTAKKKKRYFDPCFLNSHHILFSYNFIIKDKFPVACGLKREKTKFFVLRLLLSNFRILVPQFNSPFKTICTMTEKSFVFLYFQTFMIAKQTKDIQSQHVLYKIENVHDLNSKNASQKEQTRTTILL